MMGVKEIQGVIVKEGKMFGASSPWPGGIPEAVRKSGDAPAGLGQGAVPTAIGHGTPVTLRRKDAYTAWDDANVVRGVAKGTVSAIAYSRLGDITTAQFRSEEHTSELQSLMRSSYAVFCLKKKT